MMGKRWSVARFSAWLIIATTFLGILWLTTSCGIFDPNAQAKDDVRALLRDPSSAVFKGVTACPSGNGVMGEVNAKNGFGGYTGFDDFIVVNREAALLRGDGQGLGSAIDTFGELQEKCYPASISNDIDNAAQMDEHGGNKI